MGHPSILRIPLLKFQLSRFDPTFGIPNPIPSQAPSLGHQIRFRLQIREESYRTPMGRARKVTSRSRLKLIRLWEASDLAWTIPR